MTDEKKIEEQAPEQGEEKVEAVVLDENVLEQLLVGCIWDVLRRMHRVATKAITPDQATEEDDAIARHLARTLMVAVTLFRSAGEYGVLPSEELDDADVDVIHEIDPFDFGPAH